MSANYTPAAGVRQAEMTSLDLMRAMREPVGPAEAKNDHASDTVGIADHSVKPRVVQQSAEQDSEFVLLDATSMHFAQLHNVLEELARDGWRLDAAYGAELAATGEALHLWLRRPSARGRQGGIQ